MSTEIRELDARSKAALELLRDPSFRTAIDVASVDVVDACERILVEHMALVHSLMDDDEAIGTVFAVLLGWILGFDLRGSDVKDGLSERLLDRVQTVMVAAGMSMSNVEAFKRKQVN